MKHILIIPIILSLSMDPFALNAMEQDAVQSTSTAIASSNPKPQARIILLLIKCSPDNTPTLLASYAATFKHSRHDKTVMVNDVTWRSGRKAIERICADQVFLDPVNRQITMTIKYDLPSDEESPFIMQSHSEKLILPLGWTCQKTVHDNVDLRIVTSTKSKKIIESEKKS